MTNQCIWNNIKWNTEYDQYWSFAGAGTMDSVEFQNLRKCFQEVFGLDISFNGNYFEAHINSDGVPVILLKSAAAPRIFISGLQSNSILRMRKAGSDNVDMQIRYADENGEVTLEGGTSGTQGSSDIYYYFGEIGIGQLAITTYLFNNERLDNLNFKTRPYLHNTIEIVNGAAKNSNNEEFSNTGTMQVYTEVEKNYESSVNSTISKELLQKIGANKITIPRYKISENNQEYHFEGLSFPNNRINMSDEQKASGQFCHDNDLQLSSTEQLDALYWSTTPHTLPEVVFDTLSSTDIDANGHLNKHNITLMNGKLIIDGVTHVINENDEVVAYVRTIGTASQSQSESGLPNWRFESFRYNDDFPSSSASINNYKTTATTLTFDNLRCCKLTVDYQWTDVMLLTSSQLYRDLVRQTNLSDDHLYRDIINKHDILVLDTNMSLNGVADYVTFSYNSSPQGMTVGKIIENKPLFGSATYETREYCNLEKEKTILSNLQTLSTSTENIMTLNNTSRPSSPHNHVSDYDRFNGDIECYMGYARAGWNNPLSSDWTGPSLSEMEKHAANKLGLGIHGVFECCYGWVKGYITTWLGITNGFSYLPTQDVISPTGNSTIDTYKISYDTYYYNLNKTSSMNHINDISFFDIGYVNKHIDTFALGLVIWRNVKNNA